MKQDQLAVTINSTPLQVKEHQRPGVVTLKEIDQVHQRPDRTAGNGDIVAKSVVTAIRESLFKEP